MVLQYDDKLQLQLHVVKMAYACFMWNWSDIIISNVAEFILGGTVYMEFLKNNYISKQDIASGSIVNI